MGEEQSEGLGARWEAWRADRRIIAGVCACVAVAAGVAWWRAGSTGAAPAASPRPPASSSASEVATTSSTRALAPLIVNVVGAVRKPGIVRVAAGARVFDAITAAGGATAGADLTRLNLAAPVADGTRVAVPTVGQPAPGIDPAAVTGGGGGGGGSSGSGGGGGAGPVNLNAATAAELDELPGVGPATAAAIVQDREQHGPFRSVGDLERVRGIGPAKLEQLRDLVTV